MQVLWQIGVSRITGRNGPLKLSSAKYRTGGGKVRIRVEACGVCYSDSFAKAGTLPGIQYSGIPAELQQRSMPSVQPLRKDTWPDC